MSRTWILVATVLSAVSCALSIMAALIIFKKLVKPVEKAIKETQAQNTIKQQNGWTSSDEWAKKNPWVNKVYNGKATYGADGQVLAKSANPFQ
jgi:hypothetical protein